jgi:dTDP-4-dehydrorhamnose 3,5-epimerase
MIDGVRVKPLAVHADDRGALMEILRDDDGLLARFGQSTFTVAYPGVIKAFHRHARQDDLWFFVFGNARVVLHDMRPESATHGETNVFCLGELRRALVFIPRGVAHGYQVLGAEPCGLVYYTTEHYDPTSPDEERIPHDDPAIGFDWRIHPR